MADGVKLTIKQRAFIDRYLETGNATRSAEMAGYSKKTARQVGAENLAKPYILAEIDERIRAMDNERIASAEEVLKYLTSCMRGEFEDEVVSFYDGVEQRADVRVAARDRTKAAELLGKRYRLFVDRIEADVDSEIVVRMEGLEDLMK